MEAILQGLWSAIQGEVVQGVATVVILAIGFLVTWVTAKIAKAQQALADKSKSDLLDAQIQRAGEFAEKIVHRIEEKAAKYIREAVKDGKVDKEELERLGADAYNELVNQIGADGMLVLQEGVTDVQKYLTDLIEQKVREAKAVSQVSSRLGIESPKV